MNYHHMPGCALHPSPSFEAKQNAHRFGTCDFCPLEIARLTMPCPMCRPPFDVDAVIALLMDEARHDAKQLVALAIIAQLLERIRKLEALQPVQLEQLASAEATLAPPNGEEIDS